ncbi:hypothetical protein L208DRAFT_1236878, partial [Tricholoma matsutake]
IQLDENQVLIGLWWQSPAQVTLLQQFSDLLITDNSYNRNQYGYPLNIGIIIDNFGKSRNAWYAFHHSKDIATHTWVFQCHLDAAGKHPKVVASDRHPSLLASVPHVMPLSHHVYCLHHLNGNVTVQLRAALGSDWINFNHEFWATYWAYLEEELYPCREKWAWAWIMTKFTAGVRTNDCAEAENKTSKTLGNAKKTLLQVFDALNQRTLDQTDHELIQTRESSRRQHNTQLESLFLLPLATLQKYVRPFALHTCHQQMQHSLFYCTEVVQLPPGVQKWASYQIPFSAVSQSADNILQTTGGT